MKEFNNFIKGMEENNNDDKDAIKIINLIDNIHEKISDRE